jgi:hypothetical protein
MDWSVVNHSSYFIFSSPIREENVCDVLSVFINDITELSETTLDDYKEPILEQLKFTVDYLNIMNCTKIKLDNYDTNVITFTGTLNRITLKEDLHIQLETRLY